MTVCSVPVPHNPTANVAIQILTSATENDHQFILIDNDTTGLTAGLQSEGLTGSPLERVGCPLIWLRDPDRFYWPAAKGKSFTIFLALPRLI